MSEIKKYNCAAFKGILRENNKLTLLLLDIDSFSNINDSYGVEYGDIVFVKVVEMLHKFRFENIEIYKLESDEFALVCAEDFNQEKIEDIAKQIVFYFNEVEIELDEDLEIKLSLSIGIAVGRGIQVLNNARLAIKELRLHTKGSYLFYDMKSRYVRKIQDNVYWVNKIQQSVSDDKIIAFFQPIVDNKTKKINKYECLARIEDDGEYLSPYRFMDAAKETKVLPLITKVMIKKSCEMFSNTRYEFSINITNDDLQLNYLEEYLLRNAELFNISPNRIVLELLEDIPSLDMGLALEQLQSLKAHGFQLSIDDFGSESSNLSRLLEFTPDYVKIDGSFVKNILTDKTSQIITEGIVSIVHKMGIKIIAEYIHNKEVQDKIDSLGIDYSQGYFHGEPSMELKK